MKRVYQKITYIVTLLSSVAAIANPSGLFFNVTANSTNNTLTISTTVPNHTYDYAGIKLVTPGYSLAGSGSECMPDKNGYCLFSVSDTSPVTLSIAGTGYPLDINLCLNGKGPLTCQRYEGLSFSTTPRFLYVGQTGSTNPVLICPINANTGYIETCSDAGGGPGITGAEPQGMVLNNAGNTAFFTTYSSPADVFQCSIDPITGLFTTCSATPITSPPGYSPLYGFITLNPQNTLAFIGDSGSTPRILACPLVNNVMSGACTDTGATPVNADIEGIILNSAGTTAYYTNYSGVGKGTVVCSVNGSSFSSCVLKTGGGSYTFSEPVGLALNKTETILYVTDYTNNVVYGCDTTPNLTPLFNSCFIAANITSPNAIVLNQAGTMAYVDDYHANTYACQIQSDGTFTNCEVTTGFTAASALALGY